MSYGFGPLVYHGRGFDARPKVIVATWIRNARSSGALRENHIRACSVSRDGIHSVLDSMTLHLLSREARRIYAVVLWYKTQGCVEEPANLEPN